MLYVHYWHFQKAWYAQINNNPKQERVYWHNSGTLQECWNEEYLVTDSEWLTHGEIKKKLTEMYPDCVLVKDKPYHWGWRRPDGKTGSYRNTKCAPYKLNTKRPIKERKVAQQIRTVE